MQMPPPGAGYEAWKAARESLMAEVARTSAALQAFPRGPMGLTPDAVKASPEYQKAKVEFSGAFSRLRFFNLWFRTKFAKEIREERAKRFI